MNEVSSKSVIWSSKELLFSLFLTFIIVPIIIENWLHDWLYILFDDELYAGTFTGLIMAIIFIAGIYFVALKPKGLSWRGVGLLPFHKSYWKSVILWTIVLIITSVGIVVLMEMAGWTSANAKTRSLQNNLNVWTVLIGFVSAAIISPIYEEIFYRGFLYKWFRMKWGVPTGVLFSSLIFMLVHIPTYNTLPINFLSGIIFAWTYEKSGSVYPGMIVHGVFNGIAVLLTVIG
ncbi:CPBP family intramembrane glutamic endopeptidase [Bacillus sp. FJAT-22090]|uniref:CPBP family intramembrane glutamic endopeptidase n=1 Tax=Bacillus sp. FJAT-22090 TaxID=1581038 RepID=UPI0011A8F7F3|nr:type II CAAX endopeptidase family protein [Bacillus sp. FJAT-22090]